MPYKDATIRREKQKECMRRLRGCSSVNPNQAENNVNIIVIETKNNIYDVNKKEEINPCCSVNPDQRKESRPWTWTINGKVIPLAMTEAMPLQYR
jgi:hypothetical protein